MKKLDARIIFTWAWLWYALRRILRGRPPYIKARAVSQLTGGPATPWANVRRGAEFSATATHDGATCSRERPPAIVMQSLDKWQSCREVRHGRPGILFQRGSYSYRRIDPVDPRTVPRGSVRSPHARRRGVSSPEMTAVCS